MYMLHLYNTYTDNLFCQGHNSAPCLDIMLLKQQHFSVSGQAAKQARQHPPVEYVYRRSHPLLQFLPQKLAEWIAKNYAAELNVPPRTDPSRPWSTATLNLILQTCIVSDSRNQHSHLPVSRVRVRSVSRGYARQVLPIQHGTPSISGKKCQGKYIYMVYVLYLACIYWSYSWYIHILT